MTLVVALVQNDSRVTPTRVVRKLRMRHENGKGPVEALKKKCKCKVRGS